MFDISAFVTGCRAAAEGSLENPSLLIAQILEPIVMKGQAISDAVARRGVTLCRGFDLFFRSEELTIYQVTLPAKSYGAPHNHAAWAVLGLYAGAEHHRYFERKGRRVTLQSEETLVGPVVKILNSEVIHAVTNPFSSVSASIHIYGNSHFDAPGRSMWSPYDMLEQKFDAQLADEWLNDISIRHRLA